MKNSGTLFDIYTSRYVDIGHGFFKPETIRSLIFTIGYLHEFKQNMLMHVNTSNMLQPNVS